MELSVIGRAFVIMAVLFFGGHIINAGYQVYRCEDALAREEEYDSKVQHTNSTSPNNIRYITGCKIPMYGMEWVWEYEDEEEPK